jgi:hypothetical protein
MDDPKGKPISLSPVLSTLGLFWPALTQNPERLSISVGFEEADKFMANTTEYSEIATRLWMGKMIIPTVEKLSEPDGVGLNYSNRPELYERVRETIATLPIGLLEFFGMGSDLCFATYTDPTDTSKSTGMAVRSNRAGETRWRIILGHDIVTSSPEAFRGILIHELCHILTDKSPASHQIKEDMDNHELDIAKKANDKNEENAIRLACELGFSCETKQYLLHLCSIHPEDVDNRRFMDIVNRYC